MLDLGIDEKDSAMVLPLLRRHAAFRNYWLNGDDASGAVIGDGLSGYLGLGIGDTIVLMGQGYHGTTAAGKYSIRGIVNLPAPDIDNIIVYIPIKDAGELYAAPGIATSAVISLNSHDDKDVFATAARLQKLVGDSLVIRNWHELNALLINQIEADNKSGMIMIGILYLVIAFGVFGTVLMMLAERRREFGMLVSIGMKKKRLAGVITIEMLLIGLIGVAAGVVASLPLVFYGYIHPLRFTGEIASMYEDYGFEPIMPTMLPDSYYLWQIIVVLIILAVAIGFSIRKIFRLNVINAMRT
jgi:ABC-type lipoprotein release transport system permease subunit